MEEGERGKEEERERERGTNEMQEGAGKINGERGRETYTVH